MASAVLELAERGYDEIKMSRVAELAGISRASLYQHFSSRDDLIAFAVAVHADRLVPATPRAFSRSKSARVRLQRLIDKILQDAADRLPWTEALLLGTSRADPRFVAQIPNRRVDELRAAIGTGLPEGQARAAALTVDLACRAVMFHLVGSRDLEGSKAQMRVVVAAVLPDALAG